MPTTLLAHVHSQLALSDPDVQLDLRAQVARLHGQPLQLTPKEFALLALLVRHANRAFSRDDLLAIIWGYSATDVETRTVDTHVLRLRKKLGAAGERIETVWGFGYRLALRERRA
jgi:DNA-binding response OmpR family regulator